ncbi:uncharacterized protein LOC117818037 [Notolabrus celidotus]|uniref:uncharacterized protein LOC117818037 n=1 Tax=Notolabrus celidotus TaxID=1203425 RepID=UPI001490759A|nr:uncharacterized protein LOC117818037 [Notolabrus celidotus]
MLVVWLILILLREGYTEPLVTTVQLGEPATLTCASPDMLNGKVFWYKQRAGETLSLIVRLQKHIYPVFGEEFSASRFEVNIYESTSNLTILRTVEDDEGMYHCAVSEWIKVTWSGTYLSLKGNTQRTSNLTVVQWPSVSDPVRLGDSVTLQCSVLSDSESDMCPGDNSVYWFKSGSDQSHPNIIYTDENRRDECERRSDAQKSCVYHLSKNFSSSDAGTYYCAVATCGQILFGDGSKLQIEQTASPELIGLVIAVLFLFISVTVNIVFICFQNPRAECEPHKAAVELHRISGGQINQQTDEDTQVYSAVVFTVRKAGSGTVKDTISVEEKRICAALKAFRLN